MFSESEVPEFEGSGGRSAADFLGFIVRCLSVGCFFGKRGENSVEVTAFVRGRTADNKGDGCLYEGTL